MSENEKNEESSIQPDESFSITLGDPHKRPEESIVGTIFVNRNNRIKSIISSVTELINLSSFNEDLEINDFARQLQYEGEVKDDIKHVFKNREIVKKEVAGKNGRWYMLELRPHKTEDEKEGVIVTFVDVTELKQTQQELAEKVEKIRELQRQIIKNDVSERWRIGQYLHDDLGQLLVSANILIKNVKNELQDGEKDLTEKVNQLIDILDQSMTGARDLSHQTVPVDIEEKGIAQAFSNFANQIEKVHNVNCEVEDDGTVVDINNIELATHLYRIAHEAAKNAATHGDAENVRITLTSDNEYLYLNIEDDGSGFSNSTKGDEGMGINIMRHRMELIGGTLEIKDTSRLRNDGATILCKVPVKKVMV